MDRWRISDANAWRHEALGRVQPDPRRFGFAARRQERGALGRGLERIRYDDCNRLVGVTDPVALQQIETKREGIEFFVRVLCEGRSVGRGHYLDNASMSFRGGDIKKGDATARDAADCQDRIEHPGRMVVGGVPGGAGNFEHSITAGKRLTYVRAVPNMSGSLRGRDVRHG
jgi:hypothetical protein